MKRIVKNVWIRFLSMILTVLLVGSCFGEYLPVMAANPTYMVKLEGDGLNYGWVYQEIRNLDSSKTYVFRCDYYAELDAECSVAAWHVDSELNKYFAKMSGGRKGTLELKCKPDASGNLKVRFDIGPNAYSFAWNVSLKEEGTSTELLENADFTTGGGSLEGWKYSKTTAAVIPYDASYFEMNVPTTTKNFMAKLKGDGENYGWLYQRISGLDKNKTYVFSCDYFATLQGGAVMAAWHSDVETNKYTAYMTENQQGKLKLRCQPDENGNLNVRFDVGPNSLSYVWNVSLKEEGSNKEILINADFKMRNGSFAGWSNATNKAKVVEYDSGLFKVVPDSDNGYYMAMLQGDGQGYGWLYQRIKGLNPNKTYVFSCRYYATASGGCTMAAWHVDSDSSKYTARMSVGKRQKLDLECQPDANGNLNVRFDVGPDTLCYVWNVSLKEKGTNKELLTNADFRKGMGSFKGWNNAAKKCEVIPYDASLFWLQGEYGAKDYMAKLEGDGKTYGWLYQRLTKLNPKKTYVFTCSYFAGMSGGATMAAWHKDSESSKYTDRMKAGKAGTLEIKCKPDASGNLNVRFDVGPNTLCYVWNVSLKEEGSKQELLINSDFRIGKGSFLGWSNGTTESKVIEYNKALFTLDMEKDDRDYMLKLVGDGKGYGWLYQRLEGLNPNRKYIFSFDYCMTDVGASAVAWWKDTEANKYSAAMRRNKYGTIKLECQPDEKGNMSVRFDIGPDVVCYVWNVSLKAKGSKTERLVNGDFRIGKGSFFGWNNGKTNSEVLLYDNDFIDSLIEKNKSLKDYENPNLAFRFEDIEKYKELDLSLYPSNALEVTDNKEVISINDNLEREARISPIIWGCIAAIVVFNVCFVAVEMYRRAKKKEEKEK